MKLRYVFIFALGMAFMYLLTRGGIINIPVQITDTNTGDTDQTIIIQNTTGDVSTLSGHNVGTGENLNQTGTDTNTGADITQQTADLLTGQGQGIPVIDASPSTTNTGSYTKEQACKLGNGNYNNILQVSWNDTLTASVKSFAKLGSFLHYVVHVSDGTTYYFYHNCNTGVATNAKNLTNTSQTTVVLSNGQVYLR